MSSRPQAISGVSTGQNEIMTVYPSICAGGLGRLLGKLYECIPVRIPFLGPKISNLLFVLPTAPVALLFYVLQKAFGNKYVLTNEAVEIWSFIGKRRSGTVPLADIVDAQAVQRGGQEFFHASDLELLSEAGDTLMTLAGLPRAEVFGETILKAGKAKNSVQNSLATIEARQSA